MRDLAARIPYETVSGDYQGGSPATPTRRQPNLPPRGPPSDPLDPQDPRNSGRSIEVPGIDDIPAVRVPHTDYSVDVSYDVEIPV